MLTNLLDGNSPIGLHEKIDIGDTIPSEALADYIKQLSLKNTFSDVTIIENNGNKFLVSVIELKSSNKALNIVAKTKAMLQINSYTDAVSTNRSYQINSDQIIESNTRCNWTKNNFSILY